MPNLYVDHVNGDNNSTIYIHDAELRNTLGQANGIATLDNTGKLPTSQLPDSVNNKLEASTLANENETEATTTATKAHAKDSKFYLAATGEYCMAKTAIAIGDTLVKDTNYTVITINGFLTDLETYLILAGQMLDTKADKVTNATNGNLAGLNGTGNLTDSGWNGAKDTTSISGNPISISGLKSNQLAVNPIITFEPIQAGSGTPSPSNIRAISGYDKIEVLSHKPLFASYQHNTAIGNDGKPYTNTDCMLVNPKFNCKSDEKFYISITASSNLSIILQGYNSSGGYLGYYRINNNSYFVPSTLLSGCTSFYIQLNGSGTSEPTSYTFETTDLSESLGQTVYWGRLNVRTGEFEVLGVGVDMGDLTWTFRGTNTPFYSTALSNYYWNDSTQAPPLICSCYETVDQGHRRNYTIAGYNMATNTIMVNDDSYNGDANAFTAAVTGQMLVYGIQTPFTIQLTPHEISLLKDYAYLSTNGTSIALDYHNGELASLSDVAQVGETVNELGKSLTHVRLNVNWGNVASGTTYSYNLTSTIPAVTVDALRAISIMCAKGASNQDAQGIYNYRMSSSGTDIVLQYHCALTQNSAISVVDVLYQS